jgi:hypothetical protein
LKKLTEDELLNPALLFQHMSMTNDSETNDTCIVRKKMYKNVYSKKGYISAPDNETECMQSNLCLCSTIKRANCLAMKNAADARGAQPNPLHMSIDLTPPHTRAPSPLPP